jgi:hypothetical protein
VYEECRIAGGLVEIEAAVSRLFKGGGDHNVQRPAQFGLTARDSIYLTRPQTTPVWSDWGWPMKAAISVAIFSSLRGRNARHR